MPVYKINLEDKFGSLALIDVNAEAAAAGRVGEPDAHDRERLGRPAGRRRGRVPLAQTRGRGRVLPTSLEGDLEIEVEGRDPFRAPARSQGVTIPRGVMHRPIAHEADGDPDGRAGDGTADGRLEGTARPGAAPGRADAGSRYCGCGTMRMYGFGSSHSPKISLASSFETEPAMITSSPCFQFTGVETLVLRGQLERVDHAQDLVEVPAGRHRVDEDELDLLVRADHEDVADGLVVRRACGPWRRRRLPRPASRTSSRREVVVADDRVVRRGALGLLDVLRPAPRGRPSSRWRGR